MTIVYILFGFTIAIVISFLIRFKTISDNILFFSFFFTLFLYEGLLIATNYMKIPNHTIANINTLIYYPLTILVLFKIWESVKGKTKKLPIFKYSIICLIAIGWFFENFILNDIFFYNSILPCIISLTLVIISIYLINMLIFNRHKNILKDSDGLILMGILIRSFSLGLLMLFVNYRMKFSNGFYINILILANITLIISNIFFIIAIICLPKKRKYTWPF